MRFGVAATLTALLLLAPTFAFADGPSAPDLVKLKDGSMYRGTIAELVANDHVVIVTVTGESKRFAMSDVESAGPASAPSSSAAAPSSGRTEPAGASIALAANRPNIAFEVKTGQAQLARSDLQANAYSVLCTAPCTATLPKGTYNLGLSSEGGQVVEPKSPITIDGPGRLDGKYTSNAKTRGAGVFLAILGVGGGIAIVVAGSAAQSDGSTADSQKNEAIVGAGLGLAVLGGIVGGLLMATHDKAEIQFTPSPVSLGKTREGVAFDARGLVLKF